MIPATTMASISKMCTIKETEYCHTDQNKFNSSEQVSDASNFVLYYASRLCWRRHQLLNEWQLLLSTATVMHVHRCNKRAQFSET